MAKPELRACDLEPGRWYRVTVGMEQRHLYLLWISPIPMTFHQLIGLSDDGYLGSGTRHETYRRSLLTGPDYTVNSITEEQAQLMFCLQEGASVEIWETALRDMNYPTLRDRAL